MSQDNQNQPAPNAPEKDKVKARVLVKTEIDGETYQPNDVVLVSKKVAAAHEGQLDASADAVKYAEALKRKAARGEDD